MDSKLSIMQWNCQGLRAKYESLKILIQENFPVCISLQEIMQGQNRICPKEYVFYRNEHQADEGRYGGSALLLRRDISHTNISLQTNLQAVAVQIYAKKKYSICSIYLPPDNINDRTLKQDLDNLIDQLPRPFLLLGDFNSRHPMWGDIIYNSRGNLIFSCIEERELAILNTGAPTHFHIQTGSLTSIDLSICSPDCFLDFSWEVMDDGLGSDHFPIFMKIVDEVAVPRAPRWILDKANWALFRILTFLEVDADDFPTIDEALDFLNKIINRASSRTIPRTSGLFTRKPVPWWNTECRITRKAMRAAFTRYRRHPCEYYLICYKKARARFRYQVKQSKRQSWVNYISKINWKTNLAEVWAKVRKITGKHIPIPSPVVECNNQLLHSPEDVSEAFADHFAKVSSKNPGSLYHHQRLQEESRELNFASARSESYNLPFSMTEFLSALSNCNDSAPGIDDITYSMIKHLPRETQVFLLSIINRIWKESYFPNIWNIAIILAFLKPGKESKILSNYRPIALTSCVCKLMEKMVNVRLVWFLEQKGLLNPVQCGFRRMRSCTDVLIRLEASISEAFASKKDHISVFFDLEKAYDTTWRFGILRIIHEIGLRGELPLFIKAFLHVRRFKVKIGNTFSSFHNQEEGVPQGSVLSVTLFALAINDISSVIPHDVMHTLFVDDLSISYAASRMVVVERKLQLTINKIVEWAAKRGFKFSALKTIAMHFCRIRGIHPDPDLFIYGQRISCKEETRFLGLIFDRKLTWIPHIKNLKVKCVQALNVIKVLSHTSWGADRKHLLILYKALVASKLAYGCEIYSSASKTALSLLDSVHHAGVRLASGAFKSSPIPSLLVDASELPLDLYRQSLLVRCWHRIQRIPKSMTCKVVFNQRFFTFYDNHPRFPKPFGYRVFKILEEFELPKCKVLPVKYSVVPPWKLPSVEFCKCIRSSKEEMSTLEMRLTFLDHLETHNDSILIFTDGSKSNAGVGFGVVFPSFTRRGKLPDQASIFTAECFAILTAVKEVMLIPNTNFVIFSDSVSVLQALGQFNSVHPLVIEIQKWIYLITNRGKAINFCWVPAHVGVEGNERADMIAKEAVASSARNNISLPVKDLYPVIRSVVRNIWDFSWELENQKMKEIASSSRPWRYSNMKRSEEVALCRMRIGHTRLTHGFLMEGKPQTFCDDCLVPLTVKHLLSECPNFFRERERHFNKCKDNSGAYLLSKILGPDGEFESLFKFLREILIFDKI